MTRSQRHARREADHRRAAHALRLEVKRLADALAQAEVRHQRELDLACSRPLPSPHGWRFNEYIQSVQWTAEMERYGAVDEDLQRELMAEEMARHLLRDGAFAVSKQPNVLNSMTRLDLSLIVGKRVENEPRQPFPREVWG